MTFHNPMRDCPDSLRNTYLFFFVSFLFHSDYNISYYGAYLKDTENKTFPIIQDEPIHLVLHSLVHSTYKKEEERKKRSEPLDTRLSPNLQKERNDQTSNPTLKNVCTVTGGDFNPFKNLQV